jgi:hypothetical protein
VHCWWDIKWCSCCGKCLSTEIELRMIQRPCFWYTSKRTESRVSKRPLHSHVHGSTTHNNQTEKAMPGSINSWVDSTVWYTHTVGYCSPLTRQDIQTHATTWMHNDNIMVSEISQPQRTNTAILCIWGPQSGPKESRREGGEKG